MDEEGIMRVVDAYTVRPTDIQVGDVMLFVVKAMVVAPGAYRIYRCPYDGAVPQGSRIPYEDMVCKALFPSLAQVASPDEPY